MDLTDINMELFKDRKTSAALIPYEIRFRMHHSYLRLSMHEDTANIITNTGYVGIVIKMGACIFAKQTAQEGTSYCEGEHCTE